MNALVKSDKKGLGHQVKAQAAVEEKQYLTFMLGGEMFSISILSIKEIIWYANLTEVPMMPACIRGVINLRGAVVPVMDLSNRFGKPSTPVVKSTCIVIIEVPTAVEGEHQNMGVVVDSVQAVLEIPTSEIEPAPSFGAKIRSDFIEGIAKVNGKFVILLNVNRVLSTEEVSQIGQVAGVADSL
ncbi:chemotaxis protein CheW [Rhodoferax antarcticus]|uniref:chemotaxis protein CheW n=1 Tax=Rhodoferax antarcticus TaxID=81479 RepID=UPI002224D044|nr:chemotaxis protein CheW [Rhodoferax antarcticus]MCW2313955.1 purine-binding chemotaxis protein CheW [Rhodoferax antarcticus]